jgi:hypothetical protein
VLLGLTVACSESPTDPPGSDPGLTVTLTGGPASVRQGDVVTFTAEVRDNDGSVLPDANGGWSVQPSSAGFIDDDGRFVGYEPGPATIVVTVLGGASDEAPIEIIARDLTGSFSVVGMGPVDDRFTSDLWLHGGFAYTGTWGTRQIGDDSNRGDRLYAWDIRNPATPLLVDSLIVRARTVNDVKIRNDGALAVLTREGSFPNGITLLDTTDPLHPVALSQFTERLEPGVHNAWIEGDFVYVVSDGNDPDVGSGLNIVDISDPASPRLVASFFGGAPGSPDFLHDVYVRDGLAFLSHWNAGLVILDVGNGMAGGSPASPVEVGRIRTAGGQVHNAWYWPATGYVFVGEEDFGTPGVVHVVDASDLTQPREVATYRVAGSTPHNFWLDEERGILLVAWYTEGLHAIDVSGELFGQLELQGRGLASIEYNGSGECSSVMGTCTWAPQLHEGLVWVSDKNSGLWALELEVETGG